MKNYPQSHLALAISLAGVISVGTQAQEESFTLEEVVVTAQKREQNLQDVPLAVQAMSADVLKQNGVVSLSDISNISPGVNIADQQSSIQTTAIRGVSSFSFGFGLEESVPYYLDGIYLGNGFALLGDLMDIEQVEVLKGPQGTLFGRNASGGAINVRTARPSDELEASLSVGAGNYELRTLKGTVNLPVIDDTLWLRAGFSNRERDGWQTNVVDGEKDGYEQDRWSGFIKALWLVSDDIEVEFTSDWSHQQDHSGYVSVNAVRSGAIFPQVLAQAHPESFYDQNNHDYASGNEAFTLMVPDGFGGFVNLPIAPTDGVSQGQNRKIRGSALKVSWDITPEMTLTSLSSYREVESYLGSDSDGTNLGLSSAYNDDSTEEYNQELRLTVSNELVDWFVGLNAYRQDRSATFHVEASGLVPLSYGVGDGSFNVSEDSSGVSKTESYALFGDAIWHISDAVNISAGLRYSYDAKSFRQQTTANDTFLGQGIIFPNLNQLADPSSATLHDNWSNLSGRLVVDYQLDEDIMVYAGVSQGYKSGGFNTTRTVEQSGSFVFTAPASIADPFDEETNINFEVGVKSKLMDGRVRLNSSLFHYTYENLQFLLSDASSPVARTVNASEVTGQGWETDITFRATESLTLFTNVSFMDVEYSKDVVDGSGTLRTSKGTDRSWSPHFSGSLGVDYARDLAELGELRVNLTYSYTGDQRHRSGNVAEGVEAEANTQKAYDVLNGRVSFYSADDKWEVAVWGKNLLDENYRGVINGATLATAGVLRVTSSEPRTFGVEASYNF